MQPQKSYDAQLKLVIIMQQRGVVQRLSNSNYSFQADIVFIDKSEVKVNKLLHNVEGIIPSIFGFAFNSTSILFNLRQQ